ncbi:hypothetical protein FACS1894214_0030 [Planctomycetales bacterium]|nr:hypothetical protein FACS1894214_0030 [Planctomycetales bacterium]
MSTTIALISPSLQQVLSAPYHSGWYLQGKIKVMQEFLAELLTKRGSVRFDPEYGCELVDGIGKYNAITALQGFIARCVADVQEQMQYRLTGEEPPEEVLEGAEVEDVVQELDKVIAKIQIYTAAGDAVSFQLPFEINK